MACKLHIFPPSPKQGIRTPEFENGFFMLSFVCSKGYSHHHPKWNCSNCKQHKNRCRLISNEHPVFFANKVKRYSHISHKVNTGKTVKKLSICIHLFWPRYAFCVEIKIDQFQLGIYLSQMEFCSSLSSFNHTIWEKNGHPMFSFKLKQTQRISYVCIPLGQYVCTWWNNENEFIFTLQWILC